MAISSFTGSSSQEPLSEINVTPFVDVMLVLLVIFMVTAPLIQQSVHVDLPQTQSQQSATISESDVVLVINAQKEVFLLKNKIALKSLTPKLQQIYRDRKDKEIFLQADHRVPYGFVVKVMALVKNAGVNRMGMITEPETR